MRYRFEVTTESLVNLVLWEDAPVLARALEDSVGSRPPRGAQQDGPSTYWIDLALRGVRARFSDHSNELFAAGNATYLRVSGGWVEARYDVDSLDEGPFDRIQVDEFIDMMEAWRVAVVEVSPNAPTRVPPPSGARPTPLR